LGGVAREVVVKGVRDGTAARPLDLGVLEVKRLNQRPEETQEASK